MLYRTYSTEKWNLLKFYLERKLFVFAPKQLNPFQDVCAILFSTGTASYSCVRVFMCWLRDSLLY